MMVRSATARPRRRVGAVAYTLVALVVCLALALFRVPEVLALAVAVAAVLVAFVAAYLTGRT